MDAEIITPIIGAAVLIVAVWIMAAHFDQRNQARFEKLQEQICGWRLGLHSGNDLNKEVLRAEMRAMRAEIRLEIREAADRRLIDH